MDVDRLSFKPGAHRQNLHGSNELEMRWISQMSCVSLYGPPSVRGLAWGSAAPLMPDNGFFDFMREHGGETRNGARGAAMGQLTLDHLRHTALLQHDEDTSLRLWQWTAIEVDELRRVETKRAEIDAIFVDRGAVTLHLFDQSSSGLPKAMTSVKARRHNTLALI